MNEKEALRRLRWITWRFTGIGVVLICLQVGVIWLNWGSGWVFLNAAGVVWHVKLIVEGWIDHFDIAKQIREAWHVKINNT